MKLYYKPGACSQSCHIALREAGLAFTPVKVDLARKTLEDGSDYLALNPKGYVPALGLDTGEILTEVPVILQYVADLVPARNLAPAAGTMGRYRVQEWLSFTSSELHKNYALLFGALLPDERKAQVHAQLKKRYAGVDKHLAGREVLVGEHFSVADIFLFVANGWAPRAGLDLAEFVNLQAFQQRVGARPAVQDTLKAEFPPQ